MPCVTNGKKGGVEIFESAVYRNAWCGGVYSKVSIFNKNIIRYKWNCREKQGARIKI
jgi:hypothetical protein